MFHLSYLPILLVLVHQIFLNRYYPSCYGRVVKAVDLKSTGISRAGSNPAGSAKLFISVAIHSFALPWAKLTEARSVSNPAGSDRSFAGTLLIYIAWYNVMTL